MDPEYEESEISEFDAKEDDFDSNDKDCQDMTIETNPDCKIKSIRLVN